MIRLLIILAISLFFIWLCSEIFIKKNKIDKVKNSGSKINKLFYLLFALLLVAGIFILFSRLGPAIFLTLKKFLIPIFSLLRNFIPF